MNDYYVIFAENGFGYFDNVERLRKSFPFLHNYNILKTDSEHAAIGMALWNYDPTLVLADNASDLVRGPKIKKNWIYYPRNIAELSYRVYSGSCKLIPVYPTYRGYKEIIQPISFEN